MDKLCITENLCSFKDIEVLTVLDVLYERISRLRSLSCRYPDATLASDWKFEIDILERFCKSFEDSLGCEPLSDDSVLLLIVTK